MQLLTLLIVCSFVFFSNFQFQVNANDYLNTCILGSLKDLGHNWQIDGKLTNCNFTAKQYCSMSFPRNKSDKTILADGCSTVGERDQDDSCANTVQTAQCIKNVSTEVTKCCCQWNLCNLPFLEDNQMNPNIIGTLATTTTTPSTVKTPSTLPSSTTFPSSSTSLPAITTTASTNDTTCPGRKVMDMKEGRQKCSAASQYCLIQHNDTSTEMGCEEHFDHYCKNVAEDYNVSLFCKKDSKWTVCCCQAKGNSCQAEELQYIVHYEHARLDQQPAATTIIPTTTSSANYWEDINWLLLLAPPLGGIALLLILGILLLIRRLWKRKKAKKQQKRREKKGKRRKEEEESEATTLSEMKEDEGTRTDELEKVQVQRTNESVQGEEAKKGAVVSDLLPIPSSF